MKKRIFLGTAVLMLGLVACGTTQESATTTTEVTTTVVLQPSNQERYQAVFEDYQKLSQLSVREAGRATLNVPLNSWTQEIAAEEAQQLTYAFEDLNGDGVDELIVLTGTGPKLELLAAYSLNDQQQPMVFAETFYGKQGGAREQSTLYQNGIFTIDVWSSGTGDGVLESHQLKAGGVVENLAKKEYKKREVSLADVALQEENKLDLTQLTRTTMGQEVAVASANSKMDLVAIKNGDFSSVVGTWKNGQGDETTFDKAGVVSEGYLVNTGEYAMLLDGLLRTSIAPKSLGAGGATYLFVPAGVKIPDFTLLDGQVFQDGSDTSKDRMIGFQAASAIADSAEFYYKVD